MAGDDGAAHDQAVDIVQYPGALPGGCFHVDDPQADAACFFRRDSSISASFAHGRGVSFDRDGVLKQSVQGARAGV